jgi:phospholipid/cholesterol/gamma-HCH transport system substrate-binding protein
VTGQVWHSDPDLRGIISHGPDANKETDDLVKRVGPDLSPLLEDLHGVGQVVDAYSAGLRQYFAIYPAVVSFLQTISIQNPGDPPSARTVLRPNFENPPSCYAGFMPMTEFRDLNDLLSRDSGYFTSV